jgi:hypothetical protein
MEHFDEDVVPGQEGDMAEFPIGDDVPINSPAIFTDNLQNAISLTVGEPELSPIELKIGDCISFMRGEKITGKITGFGHSGGNVNRIFYNEFDIDNNKWSDDQLQIGLTSDQLLDVDLKSIRKMDYCPEVGGKTKRKRTRRSRKRRKTNKKNKKTRK